MYIIGPEQNRFERVCKWATRHKVDKQPIGLYHSLDGITNVKYKLLCFLTPNKKIQIERQ
jgi:hypothetical protein